MYGNADNLLKKAIDDGRNRDYKSSVVKLKKVLKLTDRLPVAMLYLGRAYHELKEYENAVLAFRLFITGEPKNDAGYFYLGRTYIALKNFEKAAICFRESLKIRPDFAPALAYAGYSSMLSGQSSAAVSLLVKAVETDPGNERIYKMYINSLMLYSINEFRKEKYKTAIEGFLILEQQGFSSLTTKLYIGIIYKEMGRYREAIEYVSTAAEIEPEDVLIKNILAELYIRAGLVDESLELLSTYKNKYEIQEFLGNIDNIEKEFAVSMWNKQDYGTALYFALSSLRQKRTAEMHLLAGECYKFTGKYEESLNHFTRASELKKKSIEPHYGRAVVLWLLHDYKSMQKILDKILRIDPVDDFAAYYTVLCSWKNGIPFTEWKEPLSERLKTEKDHWLLTAKGYGELSENDTDNASKSFRQALKYSDELQLTWQGLIESLKQSENTARLKTVYKKYLKIFPEDLEYRIDYSELLFIGEDHKTAASELKIIMSKTKPGMSLLKKYAYCCRRSGQYSEAVIIYRQILSNDPYNENYLKLLLYCMRKDGKDRETIPVLKSALEAFNKPSAELFLVYGSTLYRNGFNEEALAVFQKCVYNGINDWRLYKNMGVMYKNKGLTEWAEMYLKKAEKLKRSKKK